MSKTVTIHRLKCSPVELARICCGARSTVRRCDDRVFRSGDRLILEAEGFNDGRRLEATIISQPHRLAGPLTLVGADPTRVEPHMVPMALIDFALRQGELPLSPNAEEAYAFMRGIVDSANAAAADVDDYRKILTAANSAGDTVTAEEALSLIRSIARSHLSSVRSSS